MQRMTIALAAALFAGWIWAGEADPIHERHEMMEDTRDAMKAMGGMVKGERDFDVDIVSESLATFRHSAQNFGGLFPPGSETGGDTEARPEIWTDRTGFEQALADFASAVEAAEAAAPQSVQELKGVVAKVTKTCKGCHEKYRLEDEE